MGPRDRKRRVQGSQESTLADVARGGAWDAWHRDRDRPGVRPQFLHPHGSIWLRAGGVPALAMKFDWMMGLPSIKRGVNGCRNRYHSNADGLSELADRPAAAQFDSFLADLTRRVANDPQNRTISHRASSSGTQAPRRNPCRLRDESA